MHAPEEVVGDLARGGALKAGHVNALRIDPPEDVPNGPVFSAGVHALQHDEQLLAPVHEETLLQVGQALMQTG